MTTTPDDDVPVGGQGPARTVRTFGPGAVIGAAVGGIVVGVVLSLATGPVPGASGGLSAERDLDTACRYVEDIGEVQRDDVTVDGPLLWRLDAAVTLAVAVERAGAGDDGLERAVSEMFSALQDFDTDRLNEAGAELMTYCE